MKYELLRIHSFPISGPLLLCWSSRVNARTYACFLLYFGALSSCLCHSAPHSSPALGLFPSGPPSFIPQLIYPVFCLRLRPDGPWVFLWAPISDCDHVWFHSNSMRWSCVYHPPDGRGNRSGKSQCHTAGKRQSQDWSTGLRSWPMGHTASQ